MSGKVTRSSLCLKRIISVAAVSEKTERRPGQMQGNQLGGGSSHLGREDGVWAQGSGCGREGWVHSGCALTLEPRTWMSVPQRVNCWKGGLGPEPGALQCWELRKTESNRGAREEQPGLQDSSCHRALAQRLSRAMWFGNRGPGD